MNAGPAARRIPTGAAFTLIELLVVISIIAMLMAIGAPPVLNSIKASRLTGAGEKLLGALSEAQQTAYAQNYPVEVRFYRYPGAIGNDPQFRSYAFYRVTTAVGQNVETLTRIGTLNKLPENVMISADAGLSPILNGNETADANNDSGVLGATYSAIRFLTDGTCRRIINGAGNLAALAFSPLPTSYMTVVDDDGKNYTGAAPPKNFYTIQTDPYTGKSRGYRPGF